MNKFILIIILFSFLIPKIQAQEKEEKIKKGYKEEIFQTEKGRLILFSNGSLVSIEKKKDDYELKKIINIFEILKDSTINLESWRIFNASFENNDFPFHYIISVTLEKVVSKIEDQFESIEISLVWDAKNKILTLINEDNSIKILN